MLNILLCRLKHYWKWETWKSPFDTFLCAPDRLFLLFSDVLEAAAFEMQRRSHIHKVWTIGIFKLSYFMFISSSYRDDKAGVMYKVGHEAKAAQREATPPPPPPPPLPLLRPIILCTVVWPGAHYPPASLLSASHQSSGRLSPTSEREGPQSDSPGRGGGWRLNDTSAVTAAIMYISALILISFAQWPLYSDRHKVCHGRHATVSCDL